MNLLIKFALGLSLLTLVGCGSFGHKKKCTDKAQCKIGDSKCEKKKQCPLKTKKCEGKKQCPKSQKKCDKKKQCPKSQKKCDKKKQCPKVKKQCPHKAAKKSAFAPVKKETFGNLKSLVNVKWLDFSGRPNKSTAANFKKENYKLVINILGAGETKYDEKSVVEKQGIAYHNIPLMVNGEIDKAAVAKIHGVVAKYKGQKTLIHCSSGNRVASWFGAHMYLDHKVSKAESMILAKNAGMTKTKMQNKLQAFFSKN